MVEAADKPAKGHSKSELRTGFRRSQKYIGTALLASAGAGAFLLATDQSLWILAISHALGLIIIVVADLVIGLLSLASVKRAYLPSLAAALLGLLLQLGDILTAPQYNMSVQYFASYLFGLWAFDLLLALQVVILAAGVAGRAYAQHLAKRRTLLGGQLDYTRRGFLKSLLGLAGLVAVAVGIGSVKIPSPLAQNSSSGQQPASKQNPIANVNSLKAGSPVYFQYPAGYPNVLLKQSDGSLVALSLLCTHVCCECYYDTASSLVGCPCHGSVFDTAGNVLRGPAAQPLPKVQLEVDSTGNVFPKGVSGSSPCFQF